MVKIVLLWDLSYIESFRLDLFFLVGKSSINIAIVTYIRQLKGMNRADTEFETLVKRAQKYNNSYFDYITIIRTPNQEKGKILVDEAKYWKGESKTSSI